WRGGARRRSPARPGRKGSPPPPAHGAGPRGQGAPGRAFPAEGPAPPRPDGGRRRGAAPSSGSVLGVNQQAHFEESTPHHHFIRAPFSSTAKIQPTTFPG